MPNEDSKQELGIAEAVRGYAGLAAVLLGVVYVYGALIKATQFHGAGQSITDTLPLVPLEQILLAGINASLLLIAATIFTVLLILFIKEIGERRASRASPAASAGKTRAETKDHAEDQERQQNWLKRHIRQILFALLALCWLFLVLVSPPSTFVGVAYLGTLLWWRWPPHITRQRWALVGSVLFVCVMLATNYVDPKPLPKATITTIDEREITGDLLVNTGSTWYVGIEDHRFEAVQSTRIKTADVETQERDDESVFELLTGEKLLGLPRD